MPGNAGKFQVAELCDALRRISGKMNNICNNPFIFWTCGAIEFIFQPKNGLISTTRPFCVLLCLDASGSFAVEEKSGVLCRYLKSLNFSDISSDFFIH